MADINLRTWGENCRLHEAETRCRFKVLRPGADGDLEAFAKVCHDLVLDRPTSFTMKARIRLYKRWMASKQPCLLAADDGRGNVIAASIVLPLNTEASRAFWLDQLDALDIGPEHMESDRTAQKHLLVDMLARNRDFIKRTAVPGQPSLHGIGFRAAIYHLSLFYESDQRINPVLLCSTFNRDLSTLLRIVGFERRVGQGDLAAPIFRADLDRRDALSDEALELFDAAARVAETYSSARPRSPTG